MKNYQKIKINPKGWLKDQLLIQLKGLSGNLDKVWPDVKDSAWIGGEREGWERLPYWLDGVIPLAYLLDDKDLKARVQKYIKVICEKQSNDGWICPCEIDNIKNYDLWALFLIGKVFTVYLEHEYDKAVYSALYKAMFWLYQNLKDGTTQLLEWAKERWYECLIPLKYLYETKKEDWIIELVSILKKQGRDFFSIKNDWVRPLNKWEWTTHVVNLSMMIKYEPLYKFFTGEKLNGDAHKLYDFVTKYNGTAVGAFTGDECLGGIANNRGTELCSVVELMYSAEVLFNLTGDFSWIDLLEKLAFNALPATISDDMWTHQYVQQVNQIACQKFPGKSFFGTNNEEAHLFGLEPHFGCCTSNFSQGWPKFIENVCVKSRHEIVFAMPLPFEATTVINGKTVDLSVKTNYPFENTVNYTVSSKTANKFKVVIRVPKNAYGYILNGEKKTGKKIIIDKVFVGEENIAIEFLFSAKVVSRPYNLKVLEYGSLVFSLPLKADYKMHEYIKDGVERKFPYCDYELSSNDDFNYGFCGNDFTVERGVYDEYPFSSKNPRIKIKAKMAKVKWDLADGYETVANYKPVSNKAISEKEEKTLIPYGSAKLRMTEMPIVKN